VTRTERLLVSCYDAGDGGVFHPHRDNTTQGTAHRRFACSINLNADFEGGDLRFAEYGPATYRPPPGGAVVFSCALMHEATQDARGMRWFFDPADAVGPLYGSGAADPAWFLLDPALRLLDRAPIGAPQALFARLAALPPLAAHAGVPLVAPVLICPRVFEPE